MTSTRHTSPLPAHLDVEWAHLRTARTALRSARRWVSGSPGDPLTSIVADLDDLDEIIRATQRGSDADGDALLVRLVELARHDELPGRVVLQRILPGLIRAAMPYRSFHDDIHPVELVVPAAWMAIRAYDTTTRPHHIASALISDAVFQACRRPLRKQSATEEVRPPRAFAATTCEDGPSTALDELVVVIGEARQAGVPNCDIDLLRHLVRAGSPGVVARERNVTPRTIRNHRDRAVEHVRTALANAA